MGERLFAPGITSLIAETRLQPRSRLPSLHIPRADEAPVRGDGVKVWEGDGLLEACRSPVLAGQYQRWKAAPGTGGMPLLRDVYGSAEEGDLDDAMLLLQQGSDFIYVFQGSASVHSYGRLFRGTALSDIEGSLARPLRELYNRAASTGLPIYLQFAAEFSSNHITWERILLPVFGDRRHISRFLLMYSAPLDDKFEILTAVFERSPIGMIAACRANAATLEQARVLMVNARARDLLGLPSEGRAVATIRELRAWIADVAKWRLLSTSPNGERTKLSYVDEKGRAYVVLLEPLGRYAVFHVIDMDGTS